MCDYQYAVQIGQIRVRLPTTLKRARVETPSHEVACVWRACTCRGGVARFAWGTYEVLISWHAEGVRMEDLTVVRRRGGGAGASRSDPQGRRPYRSGLARLGTCQLALMVRALSITPKLWNLAINSGWMCCAAQVCAGNHTRPMLKVTMYGRGKAAMGLFSPRVRLKERAVLDAPAVLAFSRDSGQGD